MYREAVVFNKHLGRGSSTQSVSLNQRVSHPHEILTNNSDNRAKRVDHHQLCCVTLQMLVVREISMEMSVSKALLCFCSYFCGDNINAIFRLKTTKPLEKKSSDLELRI